MTGFTMTPCDSALCQWLWPYFLQADLDKQMDFRNGVRMRLDNLKAGPSGMSRNAAFSLPESWGGRNCLLPVDVAVVREIKAAMGGDALLNFVSPGYSARAQVVYNGLCISELTLENIWQVFGTMMPLMYPG
jgi:hypothetical protein